MSTPTDPRTPSLPTDTLGRGLTDLRLSVTDRCNFRCRYCMPREVFGPDFAFLERDELLTFEELTRVAAAAVSLGVTKLRLTGGEPLLRRGLDDLVARLTALPGVEDVALTTNGSLLARHAPALAAAGLHRVTVSLDAMDDAVHRAISDTEVSVDTVIAAILAAREAGLGVKVNTVIKRGTNDDQVEPLAAFGREHGLTVRFIEFMDVGHTNGWKLDEVLPADDLLAQLHARWPMEPVDPDVAHEVADRYRYLDGAGEVGVIASVTRPFCTDCTRARISSIGELFTCLFATSGTDLRDLLRSGGGDEELVEVLRAAWHVRDDRYSELRSAATRSLPVSDTDRIEMSYIGG